MRRLQSKRSNVEGQIHRVEKPRFLALYEHDFQAQNQ